MKNILKAMATIAILPMALCAFTVTGGGDKVITGDLVDTDIVADGTYGLAVDGISGKKISAQVVYTIPASFSVTFGTTSYGIGYSTISIASHGLVLGQDVKLEQTAGTVPSPLVAETTYYVIPVSASIIKLATTSAQALSGDPIVLLDKSQGATETYTLVSLATTGTTTFDWQASNDGTNYVSLGVSSAVLAAQISDRSFVKDFDDYNYNTLALVVTAPTAGIITTKVILNVKQ